MPDEQPRKGLSGAILSKAGDLGIDETNFVKEALKWQYNWIGLAGAAAFAAVSGTGLPLILAAGLELIYLSVVPQSSRFRRLVRSWKYAEEKRLHDLRARSMIQDLPPAVRERYSFVIRICQEIRANYDKLSSTSQIFVGQMEEKFQGLLYGYLRLLHAAYQQQVYLDTSNPAAIQREVSRLQSALEKDPQKVQEINRKRIEILNKRLEKFTRIRESTQVVQAQCSALEDVLQLIRDQSMTMRDPQEITYRLDTLVQDVEQTESTVREVEALFEMTGSDMGDMMAPVPMESSKPSRNQLRN
jgi:hypothetical protein